MGEERQLLKTANFPSNSHKEKEKEKTEVKPEETRKVEKVVSGGVVKKKKSLGKRFMETFVGEDVKNVKSYIFYDVLIPAAKDTISDIVEGITDTIRGSVEVSLFGERRSRSSRNARDRGKTYVSYDKYSSKDRDRDRDRDRRESPRNKGRYEFDDIILESRGEAEEVLSHLVDFTQDYGQATVADLYDLVGITGNFTDNKWGWESLASASVSRVREGYMLNLPKPIVLE